MNALGLMLVGGALRCTAIALAGILLYAVLGRRGPSAGSIVAVATLTIMIPLSALSASSWPRWWTISPRTLEWPVRAPGRSVAGSAARPSPSQDAAKTAPLPEPAAPAVGAEDPAESAFLAEFWQRLRSASAVPAAAWSWPAWCVVLFLAPASLGLLRLALGLRAVRVLRNRSQTIHDPSLCDLLDILRAQLGSARRVSVQETTDIATPATVGWLRPVILLPVGWREWDESERRAVLAHELAHVCRHDYFSGLLAQSSVALHFYHPLAHWLLGRLRLQQELAADSWAARLLGGSQPYLTTLARMALRQAEEPMSWPARAFLPTRGTFLRRIEMLRNSQTVPPASVSKTVRGLVVGALAGFGLLIAGLRGGDGPSPARAQAATPPQARPAAGAASAAYNLTYVPAATDLMVAARPSALFSLPSFHPIVEVLHQAAQEKGAFNLPLEEMDQVLLLWLRPEARLAPDGRATPLSEPSAAIFHSTKAQDWKKLAASFVGETTPAAYMGHTYNKGASGRPCYFAPDDRTMIIATERDLQFLMSAGSGSLNRHAWDEAWKEVDKGQLTIALGTSWLTQRLVPRLNRVNDAAEIKLDAFAPLWTRAHGYALGLDFLKGLSIDIAAACGTEESAEKVQETARAVLTLAGNAMEGLRQHIAAAPRQEVQPLQLLADTLDPLLQKAKSEHEGRIVHVRSSTDVDMGSLVKTMTPAILSARNAAKRAQSVNNLKQLALAMYNYESTNGKFPPAVLYGPDGKTPYSWRVALLPFLEQQSLYNRYKFDEPWDGPNNRKLLDECPAVLRHLNAEGTRNSSYFALVGPDSIFGVPGGTRIADVTDGTSNTIMFVEAKRDIPWTKPEDLPYDAGKPVPELGGFTPDGFNAAMCDGAVRFIKSTINERILRALITRSGGEVIASDSY